MNKKALSGKRVALYFIAFFGVVAAMDAFMVTSAIRTHSGLITDRPYEKGLAYNQVVEASNAQDRLGWLSKLQVRHAKGENDSSTIVFELKDQKGKVIKPDSATAIITRPTQQGMDFTVELKGEETPVRFPAKGIWELRVDAKIGEHDYQHSKRFVVP